MHVDPHSLNRYLCALVMCHSLRKLTFQTLRQVMIISCVLRWFFWQREGHFGIYIFLDSLPAVGQNYYQIMPLSLQSSFSKNLTMPYLYFMTFIFVSKAYFHWEGLPFPRREQSSTITLSFEIILTLITKLCPLSFQKCLSRNASQFISSSIHRTHLHFMFM